MSFPPRAPIGIATYGFRPVSMVPMPMGILPTAAPPRPGILGGLPRPPAKPGEKGPVTTVFVGNISERAPDAMIKQMLARCGSILSWKRVQGASGKLQAFGFCEYDNPEATLRAIRLLHEWNIVDKKLVVKVDGKTQALLDEHKAKKRAAKLAQQQAAQPDSEGEVKEEGENGETDDELDEATVRQDRVAKAGLDALMREHSEELMREPAGKKESEEKKQREQQRRFKDKDEGLEDLELEEEKKDLINREIRIFRDMHKNDERQEELKSTEASQQARERLERDRRRRQEAERERERERLREWEKTQERRQRKERERSRSRENESRERSVRSSRNSRERREKEEEEEELKERKKLERRLREKEAAYQDRLKNWETRERKKAREFDKEKEKEEEKKVEEEKEARRLKEFLEDYDDDRDDQKYYKGSALIRRLKEREKEIEADNRDRQREKEEIEEIKRQLLDQGHPDPESVLAKLEEERKEHLRPRLKLEGEQARSPSPEAPDATSRLQAPPDARNGESGALEEPPDEPMTIGEPQSASRSDRSQSASGADSPSPPHHQHQRSASPQPQPNSKRKKLTVDQVFNQDEEDEAEAKRRKLSLPEPSDEPVKPKIPVTAEEKRDFIKQLIDSIPTSKDSLFAYKLDWTQVDVGLMNKRIKPWVNKKIIEYIGEEETTLTEFICQKVMAHSQPQNLLNDVAMVLDEEAEVFVVKMWRLLIYETEAKKVGLSK